MKKISSKKSLTRKVLCSVMATGMMGVAGTAFAATEKYPDEDCIAGSYIIDSGAADQNIPAGTYNNGIYVFGPEGVNVIGTGITVKANEVEDTDALTFAAPNSSVTLYNSTITGGVVLRPNNIIATISGGTIDPVFHKNGNASEIEATSGQLTLDKVTINCGMVATNYADEQIINGEEKLLPIATTPVILVDGGTINSVESYDVEAKETAYTEIAAEGTGKVILKGVAINSGIGAYGRHEPKPGSVQVENSVINAGSLTAGAEIFAESNGFIHIYNDAKKETHKVSLDVIAFDGGKIVVDNANIVVTGMQKVDKNNVDITETNGTIAALAASSIEVNKGDITAYSNIIASNYDTDEKDDLIPSSRKGGIIQVTDGNITAPNAILVDGCKVVDGGEVEGRSTVITKNGDINAGNLISAANGGRVVAENGNITTDTINVTGGGRVVISGSTNVNLKANKILVKDSGSRVVLGQNATLASNHLDVLLQGSKNDAIALEGGTISTVSGQIFEKAIDTTSEETAIASIASGAVANKHINFTGEKASGILQLNDSMYTTEYLTSAVSALNNSNVEIVMMGKLVKGAEPIVPITVENINEKVGSGTHDSVVLTAPEGSATGIVVNSDVITSGVGSVDLTNASEKTFQVAGGKEFTLTGGATGAIVQGAESATVNVGEASILNIGAQGKNVTLSGNLIAGNGSAVDVRSNLVVAGNVSLNNATLSAAEAEVSVKDLNVNAGSAIASAKAITADKLSMVSGQITAQALTVGAITQAKGSTINVDKAVVTGDVVAENLNAKALNIGGKLVSTGTFKATDVTVTGAAELAGANVVNLTAGSLKATGAVVASGDVSVTDAAELASANVANLTAGSLDATGAIVATDKVNVTGAAIVAALTAKAFTVNGTTIVNGALTAESINVKDVVVNAGGFTVNDSVVIGGTLKVNDGKVVLDNGTTDSGYNVGKITAGKAAAVEMKSGVIEANDLSTAIDSSSAAGGVVLNGGTISTLTGQIFEKGIDDTSEETAKACNDAGAITNKTITFTSGKLMFNEKYYTAAYKNSAITALNNEKVVIDWYNATKLDGKTTVGTLEELDKETQGSIENIEFKPTENKPVIINGDVKTQGIASVDLSKVDDKSVTIEGDKEFTIKGDANGNIITGTDNAEFKVGGNGETVVNLGNDNKEAQLKGNIEAKPGATINIENTTNVVANDKKEGGKVKLEKATVNVKNGALHANEMALEHANLHSAVQAAVNVQQLTVAGETNITGNVNVTGDKEGKSELKVENGTGTVINVGADEAAGVVVADNTTLNGATLFLDPAYFNGIEKGSKFATGTTTLDGKYVAGRNSLIVFGEAKTDSAEKAFNATNLNWENVAAAVYLAAPITMDKDSALVVNGGLSDLKELGEVAEKSVTFADKSMLMVAGAKPETVAINGASKIEVKSGSKLMLIGAEDAKVYTVFGVDAEKDNENARWAYDNVISDEIAMVFVSASEEEGIFAGYKAKLDSLAAIYGDSVTAANVLDAVRVDKENKTAQDFFAAVGNDYGTKEARAKALNNVTTATAQAGVASSAIVANAEVANAIGDHLGFASVAEVGGNGARLNKENGSVVWAKLIHKKADIDGLKVGSIGKADYDVKQNGIVAGLDIVNTEDKAFGVAITYMDGKVTGVVAKNDTENYGLSVYGKKKVGKAAIIADLSYIHGENDIKAGTVTEKPKSDALSLGIKAETAIKSGVGQFVPYVGARVTRLGIGDYKDSIGIKHDSDVENLFNIPVGIKYSANIQKGNWTMRPTVDLGYVFNVGNKDGQETVSYGGASNTFSYEMVDKSSFVGALGFEVENKNVAYNLGYQYTKGDNTKAHKYMLGFKVKF